MLLLHGLPREKLRRTNRCYFFLVRAHPEHAKTQLQHILKYLDASIRTVYVWEMGILNKH